MQLLNNFSLQPEAFKTMILIKRFTLEQTHLVVLFALITKNRQCRTRNCLKCVFLCFVLYILLATQCAFNFCDEFPGNALMSHLFREKIENFPL